MFGRKSDLIFLIVLVSASVTAKALAQDVSLPIDVRADGVIVLDPGHGGHDSGAVGPSGLTEKRATLILAKEIRKKLAGAYSVHLTRNGDYWVDIEKRTAVANHFRADILVSLHVGGGSDHKARGMTIYWYGNTTSQELTTNHARHDVKSGERLPPWGSIQSMHATKSKRLADLVHSQLLARLNPLDRGIHNAPCLILKGADMPAILVEIGYISHPVEEKDLGDSRIISAIAEAIGQGIEEFLRQSTPCIPQKDMIQELSIQRGVAQPGSAPALGAGSRRFKSSRPDQ